jgi:hypothetical protein
MKTCLKISFFCALGFHVATAVSAVITGEWLVLAWIAAATLWMADSFWSSFRADRYYRELIESLEESAKAHSDCLKLTIENCGLETKNALLENDYNKRQIRRKMHFDRLRKSC